jgi:hypothetical protein
MSEYFFSYLKKISHILATCGEYFCWQTCQSSVESFQQPNNNNNFSKNYFNPNNLNNNHQKWTSSSCKYRSLRGASVVPFPGPNLWLNN